MGTKINKILSKKYIGIKKALYIFSGAIIIIAIIFIIIWGGRPYGGKLHGGDIAMRSIYAPFSFNTRGDIDEEATNSLKEEIVRDVENVYVVNTNVEKRAYQKLDDYFNRIDDFKKTHILSEENINLFAKKLDTDLTLQQIKLLLNFKDLEKLHKVTRDITTDVFSQGVISILGLEELRQKAYNSVIVYRDNKKNRIETSSVTALSHVNKAVIKSLTDYFPEERNLRKALSVFLTKAIEPNIEFSGELTQERKSEVKSKVAPVYKVAFVKKSELIVEKGQRINQYQIRMLNTIDQIQRKENKIWYILGISGIVLLFTFVLLLFLYIYQPLVFNRSNILLIGFLCLILVVAAKGIIFSPLSSYLIPLASISMLSVVLLNFQTAILLTVLLSFISGLIVGDGLSIAMVLFSGGILSIFMLRKVRGRIKILQTALIVGAVNFITISLLGFFQNLDYRTFLTQGVWGIGNGFFSGLLVMGLLPLFEHIFNITTDISLLEQSDLNHPLLKKMILEAPGTYHHSLIVGNLSEVACDEIKANSLLARVSSYFHDIGKIEKSEYFSENQTKTHSKHDKLTPDMSKLIIIKHVKNGIELAHKCKLKQAIIDIIAQHHGTGLVFYFFKRALDEKVDESKIDEEYFRYPGPKPQTKEAAVVLLADSVEAASRALSSPTPSRIEGLVRKVINNKFIDGQLDECDLTLKELDKIATVFIRILTGIFHSRVEYPDDEKNSNDN